MQTPGVHTLLGGVGGAVHLVVVWGLGGGVLLVVVWGLGGGVHLVVVGGGVNLVVVGGTKGGVGLKVVVAPNVTSKYCKPPDSPYHSKSSTFIY